MYLLFLLWSLFGAIYSVVVMKKRSAATGSCPFPPQFWYDWIAMGGYLTVVLVLMFLWAALCGFLLVATFGKIDLDL
jgi:hypothetical protein